MIGTITTVTVLLRRNPTVNIVPTLPGSTGATALVLMLTHYSFGSRALQQGHALGRGRVGGRRFWAGRRGSVGLWWERGPVGLRPVVSAGLLGHAQGSIPRPRSHVASSELCWLGIDLGTVPEEAPVHPRHCGCGCGRQPRHSSTS